MKNTAIKITEANADKINAMIQQAEGRATVRRISAEVVIKTATKLTKKLDIPKKDMIGIKAHVDYHAQQFPRCYKYTPESTHFGMEYRAGGWVLTWVERDTTKAPSKAYELILTEAAKTAIISRHTTMGIYDV